MNSCELYGNTYLLILRYHLCDVKIPAVPLEFIDFGTSVRTIVRWVFQNLISEWLNSVRYGKRNYI